jgi:hypothetical protein
MKQNIGDRNRRFNAAKSQPTAEQDPEPNSTFSEAQNLPPKAPL